jgi:phosphoribosylformylglycinamidine synthase
MAGELGMEVGVEHIPSSSGMTPGQILYSESCGRFIVTVAPEHRDRFENIFKGTDVACVGGITEAAEFVVAGAGFDTLIREDITALKDSWKQPFGGLV